MRHLYAKSALAALALLVGCQSVPPSRATPPAQEYSGRCFHRPFDAGFCEQPSNFWIMDYVVGAR